MTSQERREARYQRRRARRLEKKRARCDHLGGLEKSFGYRKMFFWGKKCCNGVRWKQSTQNFELHLFSGTARRRRDILLGRHKFKKCSHFTLRERGKVRPIDAPHVTDRQIHKTLCNEVLIPLYSPCMIYDNGANQKGKGTLFATQRLIKHLRQHFRHYKRDGYVLLIDFKSYFDNIRHEPIKEAFRKYFTDKRLIALSDSFIDAFGEVSLGLGSETSQMTAVAYPNKLDHYIKEVGRVKGYGRYMDDSYIIHPSKDFLQNLLKDIKNICDSLGIKLNPRKTYITDIKHGFTFLKTRFQLTETGKIIKKPCRKYITMARKKLKKQANLVKKGIMTLEQVKTSFTSWRGSMVHRNARRTVRSMDLLYKELFS